MKSHLLAIVLLMVLIAAVIAVPVVGKRLAPEAIEIHARMAENGGWTPENLTAMVGQPVHLRLTSDDVMHGFAIGQSDQPAVDVKPGEFTDVNLTFAHPGKYTYYCTRWCGPNHWRMRGTIEVTGLETQQPAEVKPLYLTLGINLDAPHPAAVLPEREASALQAASLNAPLPVIYMSREYYLSHSPVETWQALRTEPSLKKYSDQDIWDMVAKVVRANIPDQQIRAGKALYAANCAACHGESGQGDGVMAGSLQQSGMAGMASTINGHATTKPANLADPKTMLGASPALLQGKIIRGGMGTGMPYWGPIFTDQQTWAIVAYLESLQFEMEKTP